MLTSTPPPPPDSGNGGMGVVMATSRRMRKIPAWISTDRAIDRVRIVASILLFIFPGCFCGQDHFNLQPIPDVEEIDEVLNLYGLVYFEQGSGIRLSLDLCS